MFDIITFGSITRDITIKPQKRDFLNNEICFPFGSKVEIDQIGFYSGGGGANTSVTFARQGFKVAFCGMIGNDASGNDIVNELKKNKINTSLILKTDKKITNHSVVILGEKNERAILAYRGASELMDKNNIPWKKIKTKFIYLAPLTGLLCENFSDIVNFANKNKIGIAVNPSIEQLSLLNFSEIAKNINILILNQEEASFLTKFSIDKEIEILKEINKFCPGIIVLTRGGGGVIVYDGKYFYKAKPRPERKVVDTTGAGDSFASGFVTGYINYDQDIEKSIQLGMANSESCLSEFGAQEGLLKRGQKFEKVEVIKEK